MSMILPLLQICALKSMHGLPGSHLVVMGTSVRPPNSTAGESRTNATTGFSRNSSSPTKMFDASAPGGIFFIKWRSICRFHTTCSYIPTLNLLFNWNSIATPHSIGFNSPAMLWHSSCRVVCVCIGMRFTLLKSTALFSWLPSLRPSVQDSCDWGDTIWPENSKEHY